MYSLTVCFSEIGPRTPQIWTNTHRYDNRQPSQQTLKKEITPSRVHAEDAVTGTNGPVTRRTHCPFRKTHLWLFYNSVPKVRLTSVKHGAGFTFWWAGLCLSIDAFWFVDPKRKPAGGFIIMLECILSFRRTWNVQYARFPGKHDGWLLSTRDDAWRLP